jgi:hypothetical protein
MNWKKKKGNCKLIVETLIDVYVLHLARVTQNRLFNLDGSLSGIVERKI